MNERMKIMIAYDGSSCGDAALEDLRRAGLPQEAEALVFSVAEAWLYAQPVSAYEIADGFADIVEKEEAKTTASDSPVLKETRLLAQKAYNFLQENFPKWKVSVDIGIGSPARKILEKADSWKPDLIVVGSHGRSLLGRFFIGSVSQQIVAHAQCPVRVVHQQAGKTNAAVRILVGLDESPEALLAVRSVAEREWTKGSEVHFVTASAPYHLYDDDPSEHKTRIKNIQTEAERILNETNLTTSFVVLEGNPKQIIPSEAEVWEADCIFIGSRGLRGIERIFLGSVSAAITARSACSVEVIRPKKD
jgi:nucleotide-binding universal stress UspA family protein